MQNGSETELDVRGEVPQNANEHCPGTEAEEAGKAASCEGCPNQEVCATAPKGPDPDLAAIADRMSSVKHKVVVLSGKGGVGKSTFSAQLAFALAAPGQDKQVGLLDVDLCGPSIPRMVGLEGQEIHQSNLGWSPVYVEDNLAVMSIGFLLPKSDNPVIWRGPRKNGLIKQFLRDVYWGDLDYLVVDTPPGTSDEHISIMQYLGATNVDGAVIVTTPQEVSLLDVRKEINFCKTVGIPVLGVVENMSGLQQKIGSLNFRAVGEDGEEKDVTDYALEELRKHAPHLLPMFAHMEIFHVGGGAEKMAKDMGVPFLGRVPMDPKLGKAAEEGRSCFAEGSDCTASAIALQRIIKNIVQKVESKK
ncbi:ATP-binding protein involved in chromosome partitioning [Marchantia polymorpha subsp. ruderalis]|uniref:Cytosolic Fe-S cluster assembly factor NBP35 n=2 Tax=Marchantia polymorpha TaxID=3197 RepID=A0A176VSU4_MARPO|nr:hypothetical protein AXG93_1217s1000 [Marchantia polymorpha subsp. ruderalis]PTQ35382.1 hypothetical protein MARPO_0071s0001 [Marchantia polymorpha]BBN11938.1 hypothetical protein Mp_5g16090 [Marchantia polymorpha subsp. ruderalis]|eukprot:PTQ35382.1 hypothetical protein MARPO_0071s0001 [Marchantia polymorpha]